MAAQHPNDAQLLALMERFRKAYAAADRDALLAATTEDFQWHQHTGSNDADEAPTGRVLIGVDALLREIDWRREHWSDVRYRNLQERAAGDVLVQTFCISGKADGVPFHANAVDLYPVRDGLIALKDTYWKAIG